MSFECEAKASDASVEDAGIGSGCRFADLLCLIQRPIFNRAAGSDVFEARVEEIVEGRRRKRRGEDDREQGGEQSAQKHGGRPPVADCSGAIARGRCRMI